MPLVAQNLIIFSMVPYDRILPVGFPGLMITIALTLIPLD